MRLEYVHKQIVMSLSLVICCLGSLGLLANNGFADDSEPQEKSRTAAKASQNKRETNEKEILRFVGEHQPKLLELMQFLQETNPAQYQQALRETERTRVRLETLGKRDVELQAIELDLWQVRSQQRLVAAEWSVVPEQRQQKLQQRLQRLVEQELDIEMAKLKLQRERTANQLQKYDDQIKSQQGERDALVTKALKQWENRIGRGASRSKKSKTEN